MAADHSLPVTSASSVAPASSPHLLCVHYCRPSLGLTPPGNLCTGHAAIRATVGAGTTAEGEPYLVPLHPFSVFPRLLHGAFVHMCVGAWARACGVSWHVRATLSEGGAHHSHLLLSPLHQSPHPSRRVAASNMRTRTHFAHSRVPHAHTRIHAKTLGGGKKSRGAPAVAGKTR